VASRKANIICGLDVGTSKVCLLIARLSSKGELEVVSSGYALSAGLKKGVVVNMEQAAESIRKAAEEAEAQAGLSVDSVIVGVTGDHIQSYNCHGAITLEGDHRQVTEEDVAQVIKAAKSIPIPPGREIVHVITQEFFLDNRGDIQNPIGLTGSRLDVNIHVVTSESAINQNLINAVNLAQMRVARLVLQPLASAAAVLTTDEKELGTMVVDIGAATTDIALFARNAIRFTATLPLGGAHFTRDLAVGLRTPLEDAEEIKKGSGNVLTETIASDEAVTIPGIGTRLPRDVSRQVVARILRERAIELLELVKDQISRAGEREQLVAGAVLTGGGSMLGGILELAEQVLQIPVRQGLPTGIQELREDLSHPIFATAVGLTMWDLHKKDQNKWTPTKKSSTPWFIDRLLSFVGR
jgi:cell division protein FtsA